VTTALITHLACLEHDTGPYHPETSERLRAVLAALEAPAFSDLLRESAPLATVEQLSRVHPREYVEAILAIHPDLGEPVQLDGDTVMSNGSAEAAARAIARRAEHRLVALGEKLVPDRFRHCLSFAEMRSDCEG